MGDAFRGFFRAKKNEGLQTEPERSALGRVRPSVCPFGVVARIATTTIFLRLTRSLSRVHRSARPSLTSTSRPWRNRHHYKYSTRPLMPTTNTGDVALAGPVKVQKIESSAATEGTTWYSG